MGTTSEPIVEIGCARVRGSRKHGLQQAEAYLAVELFTTSESLLAQRRVNLRVPTR